MYPGEDGRRKRKYFTNETDALDFASKRRKELGMHGSAFGTINADERAALACWRAAEGTFLTNGTQIVKRLSAPFWHGKAF